MPRAHRYFLPGHVWHITHRCHQKKFLLKFARDRDRWRHWLFESRKHFGLCVLNYIVTSNHIHLLVLDQGNGEIARSIQLIAGRTAQEYNQRKHRKGAYWDDRYHATAVDTEDYLARCIAYIDLNMVRAGVVSHPSDWRWSGYHEIQTPGQSYTVINNTALFALSNIHSFKQLQTSHRVWIEAELETTTHARAPMWSQSLAIGHKGFVENVQTALGINANHRNITEIEDTYTLREPTQPYTVDFKQEKARLSTENLYLWTELCI